MTRELVTWAIVRVLVFVPLAIAVLHDWTIGAAAAGGFTLLHAGSILDDRAWERENQGRYR